MSSIVKVLIDSSELEELRSDREERDYWKALTSEARAERDAALAQAESWKAAFELASEASQNWMQKAERYAEVLLKISDFDAFMVRIHPQHHHEFISGAGNAAYDLSLIARAALAETGEQK